MNRLLALGGVLAAAVLVLAAGAALAEPLAPLPALKAPNPDQVELGRWLFFETKLSGDAAISCATCHDPRKGWGDGKALSTGYPWSEYFRNSQSIVNAAYYRRGYWDGRMDGRDLPTYGRILNAITAFVQTIASRNAALDRHLKGEAGALSPAAAEGLGLFQGKAGCIQCHDGALLSDQKFHALGVPENAAVYAQPLRHITFRRFMKTLGVPNYDNLREDVGLYGVTKEPGDRGKFRTPSLREVALTAPYMHNGSLATLDDVMDFYNRGGGAHPNKSPLLRPLGLGDGDKRALVEFLKSLTGDPIVVERPTPPEYKLNDDEIGRAHV